MSELGVLESKLAEWREHPVTFVREVIGAEPDLWQQQFLNAFVSNRRLALKACKGPGKSTVLAWIAWNFMLTRPHPKVVCTSISGKNLSDGLWAELSKWQKQSKLLTKLFTWSAERIELNEHPETWFISARAWAKTADKDQQSNTLAGIHADFVLFLIDEAGGIPDAVVAAAEAGLANAGQEGREAHLVIAGNPTHLSGPLYRACTRERALWWVKEISSDPDAVDRTPRVTKEWALEQIAKYGRDNPWVLVNVFGQFPPGQSNVLLGIEDVTAATKRSLPRSAWLEEAKVWGVDVARFGDDRSVLFSRQGRVAFKPRVWRNLRTTELAHQVAFERERAERKPDAIFVDQTGVGAGVVDKLVELNLTPIGVDNGSKALTQRPKFADRRAEMWWLMAEWVKSGGCIPDDAELISELVCPVYWFEPSGALRLESKKDIKARGEPSPDKADALALTFAAPVVRNLDEEGGPDGRGPTRAARSEYEPGERG